MPSLSQSTVIAGALLAGFVIYITVRGQLPGYASLFTHKASVSGGGSGASGSSGAAASAGDQALKTAESIGLQVAEKAALAFIGL